MMNTNIERLLKSYSEYKNMETQIKKYLDDIKSDIVKELKDMGVCEYIGTEHTVRNITVESSRIDTKKVKSMFPDVAAECMTTSKTTRFTVK